MNVLVAGDRPVRPFALAHSACEASNRAGVDDTELAGDNQVNPPPVTFLASPLRVTVMLAGTERATLYVRPESPAQTLPAGHGAATVWGYGAATGAGSNPLLIHNAPSLTIEAQWDRPLRVKWINDLVDDDGNYLPYLLPVDPTLHWANPPGGELERDTRPQFMETPGTYTGPVPIVTHVHGSVAVGDESDGYAEAWYLPAAEVPAGYATEGTWYELFAGTEQ